MCHIDTTNIGVKFDLNKNFKKCKLNTGLLPVVVVFMVHLNKAMTESLLYTCRIVDTDVYVEEYTYMQIDKMQILDLVFRFESQESRPGLLAVSQRLSHFHIISQCPTKDNHHFQHRHYHIHQYHDKDYKYLFDCLQQNTGQ